MGLVQQLYRLQKIDTELQQEKKRLGDVLRAQQEPAELTMARKRAEDATAAVQRWRKSQKEHELELERVNAKTKRSNDRLYSGKVKNPKELTDLQRELESLGRRREALEDAILEAMLTLEESEEEQAAADEALATLEAAWEQKVAGLRQKQHQIALHVNELIATRQQQAAKIDAPTLKTYDAIGRKKGGLAVALLVHGTCQGCQTSVPASTIRAVQDGTLVYCPNCGRILHSIT